MSVTITTPSGEALEVSSEDRSRRLGDLFVIKSSEHTRRERAAWFGFEVVSYHSPEHKVYRSTIRPLISHQGGGIAYRYGLGVDSDPVQMSTTPTPRYSAKALSAQHAAFLARVTEPAMLDRLTMWVREQMEGRA